MDLISGGPYKVNIGPYKRVLLYPKMTGYESSWILSSQKSLDPQIDESAEAINQQTQNHYKNSPLNQFINPNKPLAYWILNLCLEFMLSNLSRQNFPIEIYSRVLNVIHRLLVQMKKYEVRLTMLFPQLWHSLIILLHL